MTLQKASLKMSILVFIGCLCIGFWVAGHKALWNDEYYSQVASIHNTTYADQLLGHISEGGNAPLFYSLQKFFLQVINYHMPAQWIDGHWTSDPTSQITLRINPVIFMSLSLGLVFYYFCQRYSVVTGFYSVFIYFSSYMLWAYWAQARPYALLVFLTTAQSVILLNRIDQKSEHDKGRAWIMLAVTNILLSMTSILSLGEIAAVSVLWWALKEHDWRKYLFITLIPALIVLFYYMHAPKYQFFFGSLSPEQLIRDNMSRERFDFLFLFFFLLLGYKVGQKKDMLKYLPDKEILTPVAYVVFMVLVLLSSIAVLCLFALHAKGPQGFPITSRYFIYLTPIGVIATTILTVSIFKSFSKHRWMQCVLFGLFGSLLIQHFLKVALGALHAMARG